MPDEGNLDPGCSRLHHDGYETSGGLVAHLHSPGAQSNGEVGGGVCGGGNEEERGRCQGRLLSGKGKKRVRNK